MSKSTSYKKGLEANRKGLEAEAVVIEFLKKNAYKLIRQRWKSPFAEIDLIFEDPQKNLLVLEVKKINNMNYINFVLSAKQKNRLKKAIIYLSQYSRRVYFKLALVDQNYKVHFLEDVLDK